MTEESRTVRIFLLDDHEMVRRGLAEMLAAEPRFEVVGEASTAAEAPDAALVSADDCGRAPPGGRPVARIGIE